MNRAYVIGDIHGHLDKLAAAHGLIATDRKRTGDTSAPVVHLGDLVDRGPESAEVVEYLSSGPSRAGPWITIMGNHDRMFLGFLNDPFYQDPILNPDYTWLHAKLGGMLTLASYGVAPDDDLSAMGAEAVARVPQDHRAFLSGLPRCLPFGPVFFVHAGIRPDVPFADQVEDDLVWIRQPFLADTRDHGALIIHGHTVVDVPRHHGNRVNLDTGAGLGRDLTVAVVEGSVIHILTDEGRYPLFPPND